MRRTADFLSRPWMLTCVPLALFLSLALVCYHCTVDDAFISFRYARNLAEGHGLVFNVGERVEGFSNPLWVLILSLASAAGMNIVTASKLIGLGCGALTLALLMRLCRGTLSLSRVATFAVLCYTATNISFVYYAISGLETAFYTATMVLMVYLLSERKEMKAGAACAALALTRPEGILYVIPLALGCLFNGRGIRKLLVVLGIPIAAYAAYTSFRLMYYGTLLPNSYHAKIGAYPASIAPPVSRLEVFARYTLKTSTVEWPLLLLALAGAIVFLRKRTAPMLAGIGASVFFVWYSRGDWMSFWRFYSPVLPFLAVLLIGALEFARLRLGRSSLAKVLLVILFVPLLMSSGRTVASIEALRSGAHFNPAMHSRTHVQIGQYLAGISSASDVIVANEIGAIGYYTHCTVVDMLGLTDPHVSSILHRGDLDAYGDYILARQPAFIILNNKQTPTDTKLHPVHAAIYMKMMKTGLYRMEREFFLNSYRAALLYVREKDNEIPPRR